MMALLGVACAQLVLGMLIPLCITGTPQTAPIADGRRHVYTVDPVLRWHPSGKYLLSQWGLIVVDPTAPWPVGVPEELRVTSPPQFVFGAQDWLPGASGFVYNPVEWAESNDGPRNIFTLFAGTYSRVGTKLLAPKSFDEYSMPSTEPNGNRIAFNIDDYKDWSKTSIGVIAVGGSGFKQFPLNPRTFRPPAWAPGGHKLIVEKRVPVVLNVDDGSVTEVPTAIASRPLSFDPHASLLQCWSPTGESVALLGWLRDERGRRMSCLVLFTLGTRTTKLVKLGTAEKDGPPPKGAAWSPKGDMIAFHYANRLCIFDPVKSRISTKLTPPRGMTFRLSPTWSPNGRYLTCWVQDLSGTRKSNLKWGEKHLLLYELGKTIKPRDVFRVGLPKMGNAAADPARDKERNACG